VKKAGDHRQEGGVVALSKAGARAGHFVVGLGALSLCFFRFGFLFV